MAFDYFGSEEEQNQGGGSAQGGQAAKQLGQESPVVTGAQTKNAGPTASGSFTNLQSYLDANKDLNFGSQVAGRVQGEVDKATAAQNQADSGFRGLVDQGTVKKDNDLLSAVNSNPNSIVSDQNKLSTFDKMRDATYGGPNSLVEKADLYNPAQTQTDKAWQVSQQVGSEGGRKAYLDQQYGSGAGRYDYSSGKQKLDNLLIAQDPTSKQAFQNVQANAQGAKNAFSTLQSALDQYAQQGKATTADTRSATRAAVGLDANGNWLADNTATPGAMQNTLKGLDQTVAAKQAELTNAFNTLSGTYGKKNLNDLTPQQLQMLGITDQIKAQNTGYDVGPSGFVGSYAPYAAPYREQAGYLEEYDPRNYITMKQQSDLNRSTLADDQMQAKIAALSRLGAKENSFIDPSQAGRMVNQALYTADGQKLSSDALTRQNQAKAELAARAAEINAVMNRGGLVSADTVKAQGNAIRAKYGLPPL